MEIAISTGSLLVSIIAVAVAWYSIRTSRLAIGKATTQALFAAFESANRSTVEYPDLLKRVHGLPEDLPDEEARAIAYLSTIMDGFQHYYGQLHDGDFEKMLSDINDSSNFLSRILSVPENKVRWEAMKSLYYGQYDEPFIRAIDAIIARRSG